MNDVPAHGSEPSEQLLAIAAGLQRELTPGRPPHRADMDASLDSDWGFDSLARAELFLRIERALGVSLPEPLLAEAETLREVDAAVAALATSPAKSSRSFRPQKAKPRRRQRTWTR